MKNKYLKEITQEEDRNYAMQISHCTKRLKKQKEQPLLT